MSTPTGERLATLPLREIRENPDLLRHIDRSDPDYLGLVDSVRKRGILQPILVREVIDPLIGDFVYLLVDGLNRFNAAKDAGLDTIPCKIVVMSDEDVLYTQVVTNTHRIETKPVELARQFQKIMAGKPTMTKAELAGGLNKSPAWLDGILKLTNLIPEAAKLVDDGKIPLSNGQTLAKLPPDEQVAHIEQAITQSPAEFAPAVNARVKALRDDKRVGNSQSFRPQAYLRKLCELKGLLEDPASLATVANIVGASSLESFQLGIQFCLHLDAASAREQQRRCEARNNAE